MKKKVLIIGGSSLIGSTLCDAIDDDFDVSLTFNENKTETAFPSFYLNLINDREKFSKLITEINPDFVINTVAYPSVDFCETNKDDASLLHVTINDELVSICKDNKSSFVYFSTDAVFDGKKHGKYNEDDAPNPQSHYGLTKLEAEKLILQNKKNIVLRTTVIYGWHERSRFTNWVLKNLKEDQPVTAFTDQSNTPTLVNDIATLLSKMMKENYSGLYHCAGKSCVSRYEFAKKLSKKFGYDDKLIKPVSSKGTQIAPRPENGCLDSSKIEQLLNFNFSTIDEGIDFLHTAFSQSKTL